ncbi:MAG: heavy-metal-associated domain-containing protein [Acidobacteria bacterium]|nr:heavy-metal-associated domain-containing protein [Acidobacteriota bacterium]
MKLAVRKLDGIHQVEASYKEGKAVVVYEPSTVSLEEIKAAIDKVGFKAELQSEEGLTQ